MRQPITHLVPRRAFIWLLALLVVMVAPVAAQQGPPREEARVIVDMHDPKLTEIRPGVEYRHWHGTGASIAVLRLRRGEQKSITSESVSFGQELLTLVEGEMQVRFEDHIVEMKSGDVAAWGDLDHTLVCNSDECLFFSMLVPIQWRTLGLEGEPEHPAYFSSSGPADNYRPDGESP